MFVVGVTGGIGSGKTTVTDIFAKHSIDIVDADQVARKVVATGTSTLTKISEHFGTGILLPNGELDRAGLRKIIFENTKEKTWLEKLLHPLIREHIQTALSQSTSAYCILSSPLLIETQQSSLVDRILVVDIDETTQVLRAGERDNVSNERIKKIMASQLPREKRLSYADDIVDNSGDSAETVRQVGQLHALYLELARNVDVD